ncbi:hypothetical protein OAF82_00615 [bacterium]|nr:hypothetical protein [bacterium]
MSTVPVPQAIDAFLHAKEVAVQVEQIRPATLTKIRELSEMVREGLPRDVPVEQLKTSDFRELIVHASRRWGPIRLKHLRSFVRTWIRWCHEIEGIIDVPPRLGDMPSKPVRITPKPLYTPAEFRHLWERLDAFGRSVMGLGLFAGCNGSDLEYVSPESFDGQWFVQPRQKTGRPRRAALPSFVIAEIKEAGLPLKTKRGGPTNARRISWYWRNVSTKHLGGPRPYTSWRTTLRTVAGQVDGEALEMAVMGHAGETASRITGRAAVGLTHYVRADSISDDRLRAIRKALLDWLA